MREILEIRATQPNEYAQTSNAIDQEYQTLRNDMGSDPVLKPHIPKFIEDHRNLSEFWRFIKNEESTYEGRKLWLDNEFRPTFKKVEEGFPTSLEESIDAENLFKFGNSHVQTSTRKAIDRLENDPSGALTASFSMLESALKHILDSENESYSPEDDLPSLYRKVIKRIDTFADDDQKELKQILGGCSSIIHGVASLRNKFSDAHGKGQDDKYAQRHQAQLSVKISCAIVEYIYCTWNNR